VSDPSNSTSADDALERLHAAIAARRRLLSLRQPQAELARLEALLTERDSALSEAVEERDHLRKRPLRQRKPRISTPNGLRTTAEAAARLGCSIKTLNGHVDAGDLRYVRIGQGKKRPRRMFTDSDLDAFIAAQTQTDTPCRSIASRVHRTGTPNSKSTVVAFTAAPKPRPGAKPKK
jgi:hypothetical protein